MIRPLVPLLVLCGLALVTGSLRAVTGSGAAVTSTRIVVLDLQPHLDHVHAGSLVEIPAAYGSVQDPLFLDHGSLFFRSSGDSENREGGRAVVYDLFDGEELWSASLESTWRDPRRIPGEEFAVSLLVMDSAGDRPGRLVRLEFGPACPDGCLEPLDSPVPGMLEHAWLTPDSLIVLVESPLAEATLPEPAGDRPEPLGGVLYLVSARGSESVPIATDAVSPLVDIPRSEDASYVRLAEDGQRYLVRISPESGDLHSSFHIPPEVDLLAWYSPVTAFLVYEGGLYRSTGFEDRPWQRILDPLEVGAPILDFAVSSSGFRVALVLPAESFDR